MVEQYLSSLERAPQFRPHIPPVPGRTHLRVGAPGDRGRKYAGDQLAIESKQPRRVVLEHLRPNLVTDR